MLTIFVLSWGGMSSGAVRIFASDQIPFLQLLLQQRQKKVTQLTAAAQKNSNRSGCLIPAIFVCM